MLNSNCQKGLLYGNFGVFLKKEDVINMLGQWNGKGNLLKMNENITEKNSISMLGQWNGKGNLLNKK